MRRELFWTCAACVGTGQVFDPAIDPEFEAVPRCPTCAGRGVVPVDPAAVAWARRAIGKQLLMTHGAEFRALCELATALDGEEAG